MTGRGLLSRIAAATGGAALVFGVLGAATATAAISAPPAPAMKFYDDYWTIQECESVGEWGINTGRWSIYVCQASPWDYDLYYDN